MIGFYTKFTTEKNKRGALTSILSEAATGMRSIGECKLYIVSKDAVDDTATWVTEIWTTKEAHLASFQTEGAKRLISKALPLLTDRPQQTTIIPVGGKGL